jgi:hypothetical protein
VWLDELEQTALYVLPPLLIGDVAVRLIFGHPAFWVYLVAIVVASVFVGLLRRAVKHFRGRESSSP